MPVDPRILPRNDRRNEPAHKFADLERRLRAIESRAKSNGVLRLAWGVATGSISWGTVSLTIPAGASNATTANIAHGLGKTPVFVNAVSLTPILGVLQLWSIPTRDATNIAVQIGTMGGGTLAAATTVTVAWLALA